MLAKAMCSGKPRDAKTAELLQSLGSLLQLDVDTPAGLSRDVTCYDVEFKGIF